MDPTKAPGVHPNACKEKAVPAIYTIRDVRQDFHVVKSQHNYFLTPVYKSLLNINIK